MPRRSRRPRRKATQPQDAGFIADNRRDFIPDHLVPQVVAQAELEAQIQAAKTLEQKAGLQADKVLLDLGFELERLGGV